MKKLYIVGSGIKFLSHITLEAKSIIEQSDSVAYLVNEPAIKKWIADSAKKSISLDQIYFDSVNRADAYERIYNKVLDLVSNYQNTCFLTYGHPLILSTVSHQLVNKSNDSLIGVDVEVMPGISSLDMLFCDLRVDPGVNGLQAVEATELISQKEYIFNTLSHLVIWQIGVVGCKDIVNDQKSLEINDHRKSSLHELKKRLLEFYDGKKQVVLYTAPLYSTAKPEILFTKLSDLDVTYIPRLATAYISPGER